MLVEDRFNFLLAARLWTDRLLGRGTHSLKVRLPKEVPIAKSDGPVDLGELGNWFLSQAQDVGRQFDERNGTAAFQEEIDELPELLRLAID